MTEDEMVGWHHRLNGHEFEQALDSFLRKECRRLSILYIQCVHTVLH